MKKILINEASALCIRKLMNVGVPQNEAEIMADVLISTDRRGVHSHGLTALKRYVDLILNGFMRPDAKIDVLRSFGAVEVWDGNRSSGQYLGVRAMEKAIKLAAVNGIGAVAVSHGNHFGAGAYYAQLAEKKDMIGIALSSGCPVMAPYGGADLALGNNPAAVAVPTDEEFPPVVLDMAQSIVAKGKIMDLIRDGAEILPEGWALDRDGRPTTDPEAFYAVAPAAGYKGYGLAVILDVLSGILFGGQTGDRAEDLQEGPSFLMLAFRIDAFRDPADFKKDMTERIRELKSVRPAAGSDGVLMPGERSAISEQRCREYIELDEKALAYLRQA